MVPCFNEEKSISIFYDEVIKVINEIKDKIDKSLTYEFIFIDDGSKDRTSETVKTLRNLDKNVNLIKFARNFGKEAGILAGLKASKGKAVVLMDVDLQDPPNLIKKMYQIWFNKEAKIIYAKRNKRTDEKLIKSQIYYQM
ncbi:glycosyltransferase [Campylobacter sputorum]|uniref:glycosyltransferase n=1 Tax=Campylobacter sputorum TaxID=206 RepID=UPI002100F6F8|nr:glycosyltransferase [Campylobacter sputorum]